MRCVAFRYSRLYNGRRWVNSSSLIAREKAVKQVKQYARNDKNGTADIEHYSKLPKNWDVKKEVLNSTVNTAIQSFFQTPPAELPQKALDQLVNSTSKLDKDDPLKWTSSNIATLMFTAAKQKKVYNRKEKKKKADVLSIDAHVPTLVNLLEERASEELTHRDVSNLCYGLKALKSLTMPKSRSKYLFVDRDIMSNVEPALEPRELQSQLQPHIGQLMAIIGQRLDKFSGTLTKVDAGKIMFGLQCLDSDYEEVRLLLKSVTRVIASCIPEEEAEKLNSSSIGSTLFGLQGMHSKHPEVRELVSALTTLVAKSERKMDGQCIGNSLYGLQKMSSNHEEVLKLVDVLADKIAASRYDMNAQELSNAFYGLKCLTSTSASVRKLIAALTEKLDNCSEKFGAQSIGCLMFGMRGMQCDGDEVKDLLLQVARKLDKSKSLDAFAIGQACSGFKHFDATNIEVRMLLEVLRVKILRSEAKLPSKIIRNCIIGLRKLYVGSLINPIIDISTRTELDASAPTASSTEDDDANKDDLKTLLKGRVCKYIEVDGLLAALRVSALHPEEIDQLLCRYLKKEKWHFQ